MLKCVGFDYWEYVNIIYYDSIEEFFVNIEGYYYLLIKFGKQIYSDFNFFNINEDYYFIFGKEIIGFFEWVKEKYVKIVLRILMSDNICFFNFFNIVVLLIYEVLR